jgi:chloramphenicol-sensitive protein RarD
VERDQTRLGYLFGLGAYVLWGFFPAYFKLLPPAGALEVLAHRIAWSAVIMVLVITVLRQWRRIGRLARRPAALAGVSLAALLLAANWGTYIYGVNTDRVVETSLGYFINPLVSIVLGVLVLSERLRRWQWVAVGVGGVAVVVLTVEYGRPPWLALILAGTFGAYGLAKKRLALKPTDGLFIESAVLTLPALVLLGWLSSQGQSTYTSEGVGHAVLLSISGVLTIVPLLFFAGAANRIPMVGLGILQYVAPTLQLSLGVFAFHEPMPPARLAGFGLVWCALAIFTWDAWRQPRRSAPLAEAAPVIPEPARA